MSEILICQERGRTGNIKKDFRKSPGKQKNGQNGNRLSKGH